jgi:2-oxoglutarate ferredoxin oxidoreductase subunit alpha
VTGQLSHTDQPSRLTEGSEVVANAVVAAGCRFFAGYPMTPFTELLEHLADALPDVGGVCINAESELEAVGMVWGAAAAGARAATGSTGQGLSLMQESIAEAAMAGIGFVVFNMARGQGDYFQCTRGGGHGDYRTPVLAPSGPAEVAELVAEAFDLADRWRNPVVVHGDYYLAHTWVDAPEPGEPTPPRPAPHWTLDGSSGGSGGAKLVSPLGTTKQRDGVGYDLSLHYEQCAERRREMTAGITPRAEVVGVEGAELLVAAYGTMARYAEAARQHLATLGHKIGLVRPITLWPFPTDQVATAVGSAAPGATVVVYENNAGQMIDDVRLSVLGAAPVVGLNSFRTDSSAFGIAPEVTVENLVASLLEMLP